MAQDLGMDAYPSPTPTTRYRSFKSQFDFLMRETYFYFVYLVLKYWPRTHNSELRMQNLEIQDLRKNRQKG